MSNSPREEERRAVQKGGKTPPVTAAREEPPKKERRNCQAVTEGADLTAVTGVSAKTKSIPTSKVG